MNRYFHRVISVLLLVSLPAGCRPADAPEVSTEVAVQVGKVIRTTLHERVRAFGTVAAAPASSGKPGGGAFLAAPGVGIVRSTPVSEGQKVRAGDLVVRLDDRMAQASADQARARAVYARQALDREKTLLEQGNTSEVRYQEAVETLATAEADLKGAEGVLAQVQLRSPIDGVVARLNVLPGQSVDVNTIVAEIVDLKRLVVSANVPAADARRIKAGQEARILAGPGAEDDVDGRVSFVSPSVDPQTGTVLVRLGLPGDSGLRPGQFVEIRIVVEERRERLAVPRESVYIDAAGQGVLHVVHGDTAYRRRVEVGIGDGDLIEVNAADLSEGATIVTRGSYALPDTTKIRLLAEE